MRVEVYNRRWTKTLRLDIFHSSLGSSIAKWSSPTLMIRRLDRLVVMGVCTGEQ